MDMQIATATNVYENSNAAYEVQLQTRSQFQSVGADSVSALSGGSVAPASSNPTAQPSAASRSDSSNSTNSSNLKNSTKPDSSASNTAQGLDSKKVQKSIEKSNTYLSQFDLSLRLQMDKKLNLLYVQLVDGSNGKVIKSYPPKEYLELQDRLKDYYGEYGSDDASSHPQ